MLRLWYLPYDVYGLTSMIIVVQGDQPIGFLVFHLELESGGFHEPQEYEFKQGTKHKAYRATSNIILPNGQLALATGMNGDIQVGYRQGG